MRLFLSALVTALIVPLAAYAHSPSSCPTPEQAPTRWQLVGFTAAPVSPDQGFLGFTRICQAEFPDSRFCNTAEIIATTNVPALDAGLAWVNPSMSVPLPNAYFLDPSGIKGTSGAGAGIGLAGLTCPLWGSWQSTNPLSKGIVVDADGNFSQNSCGEIHPVACCALVP
jgi:hypothetical protein